MLDKELNMPTSSAKSGAQAGSLLQWTASYKTTALVHQDPVSFTMTVDSGQLKEAQPKEPKPSPTQAVKRRGRTQPSGSQQKQKKKKKNNKRAQVPPQKDSSSEIVDLSEHYGRQTV